MNKTNTPIAPAVCGLARGLTLLLAVGGLLLTGRAGLAQNYHVSWDTSSLNANPGQGPYTLDFQLIDGDGGGPNNTVTVSNFNIIGMTQTLTDNMFFTENQVPFSPLGDLLTFDLALTNNADVGTPDNFSFYLLDKNGAALPSTDPLASSIFSVDLTGAALAFQTYAGTGQPFNFAAPDITPISPVTATPEYGTVFSLGGLLLAGGAGLWVQRRRRQNGAILAK